MLLFPQLSSGAVAQYPLTKSYAVSNVTNLQEDGTRYRSSGINPVEIGWTLTFSHLIQTEADALTSFYEKTLGRLLTFTFLDPFTNLLSWSEDLTQSIWAKSPLLITTAGDVDGYTALQLSSSAAGSVQISQILQCPAAALVCFSVYARSDEPVSLTLSVDDIKQIFPVSTMWKQFSLTESGTGNNDSKLVTLSITGGQAQVSRLTVSGQPAPALYTATQDASGVMPRTRFDQDSLSLTALDKGDLSCKVRLISQLT